ncbi:hypothetical protein BASA62_003686 [Batrachochytrium salamandrivorans]|nr:hypothetical protein BASA62_003686 [Batrachochytrium salamandrivorans]
MSKHSAKAKGQLAGKGKQPVLQSPLHQQQYWTCIHSCDTTVSPALRVSIPLVQKLGTMHYGQWCMAITQTKVYYGRLMTHRTGLLLPPDSDSTAVCKAKQLPHPLNLISISKNISRPPSQAEQKIWSQQPRSASISETSQPIGLLKTWPAKKLPRASQITVTVIHTKKTTDSYIHTPDELTPDIIAHLLIGYVVCSKCIIDDIFFDSGCVIEICSVETLDSTMATDVIIHKDTRVVITDAGMTPNERIGASGEDTGMADHPGVRFGNVDPFASVTDLAGLDSVYRELMQLAVYPLRYTKTLEAMHVRVPQAVLISGPPGVGKTSIVSAVARGCGARLFVINAADIFGGYIGESEQRLRDRFSEARTYTLVDTEQPVILFIDEIDVLAPRREGTNANTGVIAQLLTLMDGMADRGRLFVIGATNRPNALDPALRRPGRFDREVVMDFPTESVRLDILTKLTRRMHLAENVDLSVIAASTMGFVGADLAALCRDASLIAALSSSESSPLGSSVVTFEAIMSALAQCSGASVSRGSRVNVAASSWDAVGGLEDVKRQLRQAVEWPIRHRDTFQRLGLRPCRGILMYGPPGCSKTTLAKAVASTAMASFFTINGASLYSAYLGDSERIVRSLFQRARSASPSVVFIDEIDTIVGKRSMGTSGSSDAVQERILSSLLNEMDGIETAKDVLVLAATNRPDMIDEALLRPGRFDRIIYVPPPPDTASRVEILRIYTRGMPLDNTVDLAQVAERCDMYTGADIKGLCREAALCAIRRNQVALALSDFTEAFSHILPTLSAEMMDQYTAFATRF